MNGEFIVDRLLPNIVRGISDAYAIDCTTYSDDWVIQLQKADVKKWIVGYVFDINSSGSVQISSDKVACYQVLKRANIPAIDHYLVRSRARDTFLEKNIASLDPHAPVVIKPLSASGGLGVRPFGTIADARRYVMSMPTGDYAVSPRRSIVRELRYFVLDGEVILAYEKTQPRDNDGLPMFNLGQGAIARVIEPISNLTRLCQQAQTSIGLRLCAVDIAELADGDHTIVEINSGFMMEHFARQSEEYYEITHNLYEKIVDAMMRIR